VPPPPSLALRTIKMTSDAGAEITCYNNVPKAAELCVVAAALTECLHVALLHCVHVSLPKAQDAPDIHSFEHFIYRDLMDALLLSV
jgi:hypothetical protein